MSENINIYDYGHFEGDTLRTKKWVFNEVQELQGGQVRTIDFSRAVMPGDITLEDLEGVVASFLDPDMEAVPLDDEDEEFMDVPGGRFPGMN